ncbi:hypothetical protein [Parasulfitobacter algicola]|uniref:Uncharacterized protein n=1 Tax=Parasulfitobacter algicola TaxID=2614809 RepID=A0ABX2IK77_9RHOB|nr:hypothetical protein [Sulfitobacter algicola]NSX53281.1 hypothetical protein [Sulfitobacter algicola]
MTIINSDTKRLLKEIGAETQIFADVILEKEKKTLLEHIFLRRFSNCYNLFPVLDVDMLNFELKSADIGAIPDLVECDYWLSLSVESENPTFACLVRNEVNYGKLAREIVSSRKFDPKTVFWAEFRPYIRTLGNEFFCGYFTMLQSLSEHRDFGLAIARRCIVDEKIRLLESVLEVMSVCAPPAILQTIVEDVVGFLAHKNRLVWTSNDEKVNDTLRALCILPVLDGLSKEGNKLTPFFSYLRDAK